MPQFSTGVLAIYGPFPSRISARSATVGRPAGLLGRTVHNSPLGFWTARVICRHVCAQCDRASAELLVGDVLGGLSCQRANARTNLEYGNTCIFVQYSNSAEEVYAIIGPPVKKWGMWSGECRETTKAQRARREGGGIVFNQAGSVPSPRRGGMGRGGLLRAPPVPLMCLQSHRLPRGYLLQLLIAESNNAIPARGEPFGTPRVVFDGSRLQVLRSIEFNDEFHREADEIDDVSTNCCLAAELVVLKFLSTE